MLTTIEGTYRDGQIELNERPAGVRDETLVIVTFLDSPDIDLRRQGIGGPQAAELRAALATFGDWSEPEMDIYNDYDAAKTSV